MNVNRPEPSGLEYKPLPLLMPKDSQNNTTTEARSCHEQMERWLPGSLKDAPTSGPPPAFGGRATLGVGLQPRKEAAALEVLNVFLRVSEGFSFSLKV